MIVALIPPANAKAEGGNPFAPDVFDYRSKTTFNYFHTLIQDRRELVDQLQVIVKSGDQALLEQTFESYDLDQSVALTKNIYKSPLLAARKRYAPGTLYTGIDFDGLPTGAQRRFLEHTVIVDGLFGILRPDDMVPNYNLSMEGTISGLGPLADFWRDRLSPLLNRIVRNCFVWDLLTPSLRAAWEDDGSYSKYAQVRFCEASGDTIEDDIVFRGLFISHLMRESGVGLKVLDGWRHPSGFRLDEEKSDLQGKVLTVVMSRH